MHIGGAIALVDQTLRRGAMKILRPNESLSSLRPARMLRHERDARPAHVTDQDVLLLFNAHHEQFLLVLSTHQHGV